MEIGDHAEFEHNRLRKDYRIKLPARAKIRGRSEEHTSELQSLS
jgi:hypothetical protein